MGGAWRVGTHITFAGKIYIQYMLHIGFEISASGLNEFTTCGGEIGLAFSVRLQTFTGFQAAPWEGDVPV